MTSDNDAKPSPSADLVVHFIAEANGNYATLFISSSVEKQTGYPPERFTREPDFWADHIHPEDKARVFAAMRERGNADPLVIEYRFRHADGSWRWRHEQQSLVRDADGNPKQIVGSWVDVTGQKEMKHALELAEERIRVIVDESIQGVLVHDNWTPLYTNQAYADLLGYGSPAEVLALGSMERIFAPHEHPRMRRYQNARMQGRDAPSSYEFDALTKDGTQITLQVIARAIQWEGTFVTLHLCTDVTGRKRAESAQRRSEALFRQAESLALLGHWEWREPEGGMVSCSEQFARILDMSVDEVLAAFPDLDAWLELVHPDDRPLYQRIYTQAYADRKPMEQEYRIVTPAGNLRHVVEVSKPVFDENGRLVMSVGTLQDVSEQRLMQEKLHQSQATLQAFIRHSPDLIYVKDEQGRFLMTNRRTEELLGLPEKDILGKTVHDLYPKDVADFLARHDRVVLEERATVVHESRIRSGGREYIFDTVKFPLFDPVHDRVTIGGIDHDITERKKIGQAYRASEERLRLITDGLPVLIVYLDAGCRFQFANKTAERWYARPASEIVGRHLREVLGESTYAYLKLQIDRVLRGEAHSFDSFIAYPDGHRRNTHHIYVPRKHPSGAVLGFYAMVVDITDRKRAEDALRQSQQRLHLITDSLPVLILYFDRDMRYRFANRTAEKWYARPNSEIVGKTVREILGETTFEKLRPCIEGVLRGEDQSFDMRITFPDGITRDGHIIYMAHRAPDGQVLGYYVLGMDMTARRMAERKIRQSRENLRRLAKRLEDVREEERRQIAYEIHDDIGQLLTGLKLAVSELLETGDGDGAEAASEAALIMRLFDELFDKVRNLAKRLRPGLLDELGLEEAISVQVEEFAGRAGWAHSCTLRLNGLRLPPNYEIVVFRVVQEALTNAARHARAKRVDVRIIQRHNQLQVEVTDDGVGIRKNRLESGESLGLIGMRERAGSIGGRMEIRRRRAGGTAVRLQVPLPDEPPARRAAIGV